MQASVHEFDDQSGEGSVLLDDGLRVPFDAETFWDSGLRLLRVGQRVSVVVERERVVALRLNGV